MTHDEILQKLSDAKYAMFWNQASQAENILNEIAASLSDSQSIDLVLISRDKDSGCYRLQIDGNTYSANYNLHEALDLVQKNYHEDGRKMKDEFAKDLG
jgi:hypothetical protein